MHKLVQIFSFSCRICTTMRTVFWHTVNILIHLNISSTFNFSAAFQGLTLAGPVLTI